MYTRHLARDFREALEDTPVILISGARQTGKSTLAQMYAGAQSYISFDDPAIAEAALSDPLGFLQSLPRPVVLDEVQVVPELFRSIKFEVDRDRRPGSFILTGSANVLLLPRLSDSLVGRMEVLTLWPLSQGELSGMREGFIDAAFGPAPPVLGPSRMRGRDIIDRVLEGGFPEVVGRSRDRRVRAWFRNYSTTTLQRHIEDASHIDASGEMPRLLSLVASQATGVANIAKLSRSLEIPHTSLVRYLNLLRASYVVQGLPAWSPNLGTRLRKTEKLTLLDSGLLAYLQNVDADRMIIERDLFGALLETFVLMELRKQFGWNDTLAHLYYFRTASGTEVDIVIESTDGRVVAIEVKASTKLDTRDRRGLEFLRDQLGAKFIRGIVLYTGEHTLPFGDRIWAMPIDALWRWGATAERETG
ncbi:MAG: ATP-binding protein [Dehalococcoidia bacterium]